MKLITWNCNGAFRKKYHLLDDICADILIIQECEDPAKAGGEYQNWAQNYLWIGENKNKGLGVFVNSNIKLSTLDWQCDKLQLFLPCRVNDSFNLLAVWTKQANSPNFQYIGQMWKYLQLHKNIISQHPTVILGDFNSNSCWDEWDRWWNHSDVVRELGEIGLQSAYHSNKNEEQGKERIPTLYMQRKLNKPYHIDYVFTPKNWLESNAEIEVGNHDFWLQHSDHMPLIYTNEIEF